jgi:hypothetical protein
VGLGGVFPRVLLEQHLAWRNQHIGWALKGEPGYVANDEGVNFWAMATGRLIAKTTRSLVDHDDGVPSLDGNDAHTYRKAATAAAETEDWTATPGHIGRTYRESHWKLPRHLPMTPDLIEAMYRIERHGEQVSADPIICIATPAYSPPVLAFLDSRAKVVTDLSSNGVGAILMLSNGDSLVTRGRNALVHEFLKTTATHLLFWDADIECMDSSVVRAMLQTGKELVGGAYPFRDGSGAVVANAHPADIAEGRLDVDETGCMRVREVGTGFMLIDRRAIVRLMAEHPECLYFSDTKSNYGEPCWALFDVAIEEKRYLSEDWVFCRRHGNAYVYVPAELRHYGMWGHTGHITKAWGMQLAPEATP